MSTEKDPFPLHLYKKGAKLGSGVKEYVLKKDGRLTNKELPSAVAVKIIKEKKVSTGLRPVTHGHDVISRHDHDNLVKIYGFVEDEKEKKIRVVMEKCDGTLEDLLKDKRSFHPTELAFIMVKLLMGLKFLHAKKIIHRDIKPSNILIKSYCKTSNWKALPVHEMSIKLADYDFVRHFSVRDPGETASMSVVGTWRYMAPEIATAYNDRNPSSHYTWSADIYSLGVVCFEMFVGRLINEAGNADKLISMIMADHKLKEIDIGSLRDFILLQVPYEKHLRNSAESLLNHTFLKLAQDSLKAEEEAIAYRNQLRADKGKQLPSGRRLDKHVQFVLVGETGVGKTETIRHLIGHNEDLNHLGLKTSRVSSETRETCEYILTSTGKANPSDPTHSVSFGIVDTPGLLDTDGPKQDARNMACLKEFLVTKNNNKTPNLVLLFLRADGNRDIGPGSVLAKSIRVFLEPGNDNMGLTDKGDNVVIVLTHALNISHHSDKIWTKLATEKTSAIQKFVSDQTGWHIHVVLLENDPPKSRMKFRGDWTVLPNGQIQPRNLFDAIAKVLKRTGDIEGKKVMESYFSRSCKDSTVSLRKGANVVASSFGNLTFQEQMFYTKLGGATSTMTMKPEEKVNLWMDRNAHEPIDSNHEELQDNDYVAVDDIEEEDSFEISYQSGSIVKGALEETLIGKGYNISGDGEIIDCWTFNESAVVNQIHRYTCPRTEWRHLDCYNKIGIFTSNENLNNEFQRSCGVSDVNQTGSRVLKVLSVKVSPSEELKGSWTDQFYLSDSFIGDLEKLPSKYVEKNKKKFEKFFKTRGHAFISNGYYGGEMRLIVNSAGSGMNSYGEVVAYEQLSAEDQRQFRSSFEQQGLTEDNYMRQMSVNVSFRGGAPEHHKYNSLEGPKVWQESVPNHLAGLILNPESDLIYYHDFVRTLPWIEEGERKKKAQALEEAFEDLCIPGRKDVVKAEFLRNVATVFSSTAKKLNPFSWKWL